MTSRAVAEERRVENDDYAWGCVIQTLPPTLVVCGGVFGLSLSIDDRIATIRKYGLGEPDWKDMCTALFCAPCSVCQSYREHLIRQGDAADRSQCCCSSTLGL